jgi:hypothetical protein
MGARGLRLGLIALLAAGCTTTANPGGGSTTTPGGGSTTTPGGEATSGTGSGSTPAAGGASSAPAGVGGGGTGTADAAAKVTDTCTVLPVDVIRTYVPKAAAPVTDAAYHQCTMSDGTASIQLTVQSGFGPVDPPKPAQTVGDLGEHAWLQEQTVDDAYLVIDLGATQTGSYQTVYVEYAGHDGKGHAQDATAIAKAVLAALH